MTVEFAVPYIAKRMRELGYKPNEYLLKFRHFLIEEDGLIEIAGNNQVFILLSDSDPDVLVSSEIGVWGLSTSKINEFQYEHTGIITIQNLTATPQNVKFLQAIPLD